eukprot:7107985-Pyramimonas_sp.AAC.1
MLVCKPPVLDTAAQVCNICEGCCCYSGKYYVTLNPKQFFSVEAVAGAIFTTVHLQRFNPVCAPPVRSKYQLKPLPVTTPRTL